MDPTLLCVRAVRPNRGLVRQKLGGRSSVEDVEDVLLADLQGAPELVAGGVAAPP